MCFSAYGTLHFFKESGDGGGVGVGDLRAKFFYYCMCP